MSLCLRLTTAMEIPEDILMEILVRLSPDSLMRFKCVSRIWSSLISSRYFTNLFYKFSSSTNPKRRVFVHWNYRELFSSSLCNLDATSSFLQLNPDLTLLGNRMQKTNYLVNRDYICYSSLHFVNAIRGLMCFRDERAVRIINFTTRQILILPQVEFKMKNDDGVMGTCGFMKRRSPRPSMWNYLGYDPVNDEYKVLSTISSVKEAVSVRSQTQVLVLGDGASWRNTKSLTSLPPIHSPSHLTSIINSILYYGALSHENIFVLMSFDFSSEDYNLIKFPMEAGIKWHECWNQLHYKYYLLVNLMNYQDQVAVFDGSRLASECILNLWVLEDAGKSKWSNKCFVLSVHQLILNLNIYRLKVRGTSRSGEIALCSANGSRRQIKYFIYNLERNHIRVVAIKPSYIQVGQFEMNIWDDVESIMYLEA